eukprot:g14569.t1
MAPCDAVNNTLFHHMLMKDDISSLDITIFQMLVEQITDPSLIFQESEIGIFDEEIDQNELEASEILTALVQDDENAYYKYIFLYKKHIERLSLLEIRDLEKRFSVSLNCIFCFPVKKVNKQLSSVSNRKPWHSLLYMLLIRLRAAPDTEKKCIHEFIMILYEKLLKIADLTRKTSNGNKNKKELDLFKSRVTDYASSMLYTYISWKSKKSVFFCSASDFEFLLGNIENVDDAYVQDKVIVLLKYVVGFEYEENEIAEQNHKKFVVLLYKKLEKSLTRKTQRNQDKLRNIRTYVSIGCSWPKTKAWIRETEDLKFGRYAYTQINPIHESATSKVHYAEDRDDNENHKVIVKVLENKDDFEREIIARLDDNVDICTIKVLGWHVPTTWKPSDILKNLMKHTDKYKILKKQREDINNTNGTSKFVLVLEKANMSLFHKLNSLRIAGNVEDVRNLFRGIVRRISQLHDCQIIHGDIKWRNILLVDSDSLPLEQRVLEGFANEDLMLCDLDAAGKITKKMKRVKYSTAYVPPELAQHIFIDSQAEKHVPENNIWLDVWSLGVLLFELCSGQHLFPQDINNDNIVNTIDKTVLCGWHTIPDDLLTLVFGKNKDKNQQCVEDAKNLIRWCLKGKPNERPSIHCILNHRFLNPERKNISPKPQPMQYHMFISHSQAEASGEVGTLFNALKQVGVHTWRDMSQQNINANSMIQGVIDSDVFVVMLTNSYMSRWYCLLEFAAALLYKKKIIVIVEENPMFWQWDFERWQNNICSRLTDAVKAEERGWKSSCEYEFVLDDDGTIKFDKEGNKIIARDNSGHKKIIKTVLQTTFEDLQTKNMGFTDFTLLKDSPYGSSPNTAEHIRNKIIRLYDNKAMIPHRRRGFEYQSMLHELLARAKINVPRTRTYNSVNKHKFIIVYDKNSGETVKKIGKDIIKSLRYRKKKILESKQITDFDYAVIVLTKNTLAEKDCLETIRTIFEVSEKRKATATKDRDIINYSNIMFIMSKINGWKFYASDFTPASEGEKNLGNGLSKIAKRVRKMLNGHEVMSYRPKDINRDYEHESMIDEMIKRLEVYDDNIVINNERRSDDETKK